MANETTTLALIVGFPVLLSAGYAAFYALVVAVYGKRAIAGADRYSFLLYPLILIIPFAAAVAAASSTAREVLGLRLPQVAGLPIAAALAAGVAMGAAVGALGYWLELQVGRVAGRWTRGSRTLDKVVEGGGAAMTARYRLTHLQLLLGISVFSVVAEEFLWRGVLLHMLRGRFGLGAASALLLASAAFGLNHFFFGVKNVMLKTLAGLLWGTLYLRTGSLLVPIAAHYTFDWLAFSGGRR